MIPKISDSELKSCGYFGAKDVPCRLRRYARSLKRIPNGVNPRYKLWWFAYETRARFSQKTTMIILHREKLL